MKKYRNILFLMMIVLLSCNENATDPCRMIEIDLTIINQTSEDQHVTTVVFGCAFDPNTGEGDLAKGFPIKANESLEESIGIEGTNTLTVFLRYADGSIIPNTFNSEDITEEDLNYSILISLVGNTIKLELI